MWPWNALGVEEADDWQVWRSRWWWWNGKEVWWWMRAGILRRTMN
jgi:hypothetical protein